ncbi:MAG: hypothetical protein ACI4O7_14755 [Aristaeellaceae bacterium]
MKADMRERIIAYNRQRAQDKARADDLMTLLSALPPGQVKNLLKDEVCAAILTKYGVEEAEE